jgi:hypothetical protein
MRGDATVDQGCNSLLESDGLVIATPCRQCRQHGVEVALPDRLGKRQLVWKILIKGTNADTGNHSDFIRGEVRPATPRHNASRGLDDCVHRRAQAPLRWGFTHGSALPRNGVGTLPTGNAQAECPCPALFNDIENGSKALYEACAGRLKGVILVEL